MGHSLGRVLLGRGPCSLCLNQVSSGFLGLYSHLAIYKGQSPEPIKRLQTLALILSGYVILKESVAFSESLSAKRTYFLGGVNTAVGVSSVSLSRPHWAQRLTAEL